MNICVKLKSDFSYLALSDVPISREEPFRLSCNRARNALAITSLITRREDSFALQRRATCE